MIITDNTADNIFSGIIVSMMGLFFLEFLISSIVLEGYFLSFYFWIDLLSIISILLDVHWFYDLIISVITGNGSANIVKSLGAVIKVSKSAKIGARAVRILRVLRIIRLIRISKLYKAREKFIEFKVNNEMTKRKESNFKNRKSYFLAFNKVERINSNNKIGYVKDSQKCQFAKDTNDSKKIPKFLQSNMTNAVPNVSSNKLKLIPINCNLDECKGRSAKYLKEVGSMKKISQSQLPHVKKKMMTNVIRTKMFVGSDENQIKYEGFNLEKTSKLPDLRMSGKQRTLKSNKSVVKSLGITEMIKDKEVSNIYPQLYSISKEVKNPIQNSQNKFIHSKKSNICIQTHSNGPKKSIHTSENQPKALKFSYENEDQGDLEGLIPEECKVGKKLAETTTKRVIILILSILIGIILFNTPFYIENISSMEYGLQIFNYFEQPYDTYFNITFNTYVENHLNTSTPIIFARVGDLIYGDFREGDKLRQYEQMIVSDECSGLRRNINMNKNKNDNITQDNKTININDDVNIDANDEFICTAIFDNRQSSRLSSILNIVKTIFICFILSGGIFFFNKDTTEMVLEPIESMIMKIKEISKNPLEAIQIIEKDEFAKVVSEQEENTKSSAVCSCVGYKTKQDKDNNMTTKSKKKRSQPLETVILEDTITKIGALLALGFGEAGCEIIAKNMQNNTNGNINPILPGKKVIAIYAFCDIRNFTDTTEILKEKVMIFVNEIAEIVHEITVEHCGSANKNIGDAFLLIWKIDEKFTEINEKGELSLKNCAAVNQICDMALVSLIRILAKVQKSHKLEKYRKISGLNKIMKNYQVKMGFGLHLGWSIEGAIGSSFKIDASYLSPHVNMASKLEEKTKDYGVQLIMSQDFVKYLSNSAMARTRVLDANPSEKSQGESISISQALYTVDLDLQSLKTEEIEMNDQLGNNNQIESMNSKENLINFLSNKRIEKYKKRIKRKMNYQDAINCKINVWKNFEETDEDFFMVRKKFKPEFYELYNKGFRFYLNGNWNEAKLFFEKAELSLGIPGYLNCLIDCMKEHNFMRPDQWRRISSDSGH